jgi:translation initiation factor 3 subunit G
VPRFRILRLSTPHSATSAHFNTTTQSRPYPTYHKNRKHVPSSRVSLTSSPSSSSYTLTHNSRTDWAEEEDEDSSLSQALPPQTITKNKDGSETIVTWSLREDGKKVKTTRRIKKTVVKTIVNPRVAERKQWAKFGQEKGKALGPQTDTTSVAENIVFRPSANWKASTDDKSEDLKKKANLKDAKIKCRICSGDHWTTKCPFKDTMAPEGGDAPAEMGDEAPDTGGLGAGGSSYVPPHLRGRGGAGEKMGGKFERDDLATLRVTNVSEIAEEQDLRDMFSRFGHVTRVFLAKDRETGRAKGFAFISYADRSDAAKACEKMDGCRCIQCYDGMLANILYRRFRPSHLARRVRQEGHLGCLHGIRIKRRSSSTDIDLHGLGILLALGTAEWAGITIEHSVCNARDIE